MADSTDGAQDGSGQDYKARFDGLMSAHQKVLHEVADLRSRVDTTAQDAGSNRSPGNSQPEYQEGLNYRYDEQSGQMVEDNPTPRGSNARREPLRQDDGSLEYARQQLHKLGTNDNNGWPL